MVLAVQIPEHGEEGVVGGECNGGAPGSTAVNGGVARSTAVNGGVPGTAAPMDKEQVVFAGTTYTQGALQLH